MDIKTIKNQLLAPEEMLMQIKEMIINTQKCKTIRNNIETKHVTDTNLMTGNFDIVDKALVMFILMKHGINLRYPIEIGGFKINSSSKRLISYDGKSSFDVSDFIDALSHYKEDNLKEVKKECENTMKDFTDMRGAMDFDAKIIALNSLSFEMRFNCSFSLIDDDDDDNESYFSYGIEIEVTKKKGDTVAEYRLEFEGKNDINLNIRLNEDNNKILNLSDEQFTNIVKNLYDIINKKIITHKTKIDNHLHLLNEYSLI